MTIAFIKDHMGNYNVVIDNKPYVFDNTHPNHDALIQAIRSDESEEFIQLHNEGQVIEGWSQGNVHYDGGFLYYGEYRVHPVICDRMLSMIEEGFDVTPMVNFLDRLYSNPSFRAVNELYSFLIHKKLPITPEGRFLAQKAVVHYSGTDRTDKNGRTLTTGDLVDKYTRESYRNNIGDEPNMPRFGVNDDCSVSCSQGLHVGSLEYVKSYGGSACTIVLVEVDPADVVSVPLDETSQKVRCCRYKVVGILDDEIEDELERAVFDDEDEDEDEDAEVSFAINGVVSYTVDMPADSTNEELAMEGLNTGLLDELIKGGHTSWRTEVCSTDLDSVLVDFITGGK